MYFIYMKSMYAYDDDILLCILHSFPYFIIHIQSLIIMVFLIIRTLRGRSYRNATYLIIECICSIFTYFIYFVSIHLQTNEYIFPCLDQLLYSSYTIYACHLYKPAPSIPVSISFFILHLQKSSIVTPFFKDHIMNIPKVNSFYVVNFFLLMLDVCLSIRYLSSYQSILSSSKQSTEKIVFY